MIYMRKSTILLFSVFVLTLVGCGSLEKESDFAGDRLPIILDVDEVQDVAIEEDFTPEISAPEVMIEEPDDSAFDFTMCFAGDINLDENWCTTQYYRRSLYPSGRMLCDNI